MDNSNIITTFVQIKVVSEEINIPNNLLDCFEHLDKMLIDSEDLEWFKSTDEDSAITQSHHGLGGWIRNNWGFNSNDSKLYSYLFNLGLSHPDDMSSVVLTSYHRHINNKELELDKQIKFYIDYWKKNNI